MLRPDSASGDEVVLAGLEDYGLVADEVTYANRVKLGLEEGSATSVFYEPNCASDSDRTPFPLGLVVALTISPEAIALSRAAMQR